MPLYDDEEDDSPMYDDALDANNGKITITDDEEVVRAR